MNVELNGEINGVEERLELAQDSLLFVDRFKREVDGRGQQHHVHLAVFEDHYVVFDVAERHEALRGAVGGHVNTDILSPALPHRKQLVGFLDGFHFQASREGRDVAGVLRWHI